MEEFKNLKRVAMSELRRLDSQYANKDEFSEADAKKYDCMMHALKCHLTAEAMLKAEEYGEEGWSSESGMDGNSGRRGRGANGQYVSRDMESNNQSYADGYSRGYSEAMRQNGGNSGHYPPMNPYPSRGW